MFLPDVSDSRIYLTLNNEMVITGLAVCFNTRELSISLMKCIYRFLLVVVNVKVKLTRCLIN
jgi:hypothetical protein